MLVLTAKRAFNPCRNHQNCIILILEGDLNWPEPTQARLRKVRKRESGDKVTILSFCEFSGTKKKKKNR